MKKVKSGKRLMFLIFGICFTLFTILIFISTIYTNSFPQGHEFGLLSTTIMCFCLAYLYPQFKDNDERTKRIKEKGMFYSYFFILGFMILLMVLFQTNVVSLDGFQTVSILAAFTITTVFSSFVILSFRY
ncbi:hypothetical protein ACERII_00525 [Evansella sp. AB-rgal1]|uniref:hypothetical protein n=1 Tax=Evansella sp. AB-rgal1 TaxID=3242696 RepID=UPI00359E3609